MTLILIGIAKTFFFSFVQWETLLRHEAKQRTMRTLQELLKQEPVFLNDWAENGRFGVISDFEHTYISKEYYEYTESPYANKEDWIEEKSKMDIALKKYEEKIEIFLNKIDCSLFYSYFCQTKVAYLVILRIPVYVLCKSIRKPMNPFKSFRLLFLYFILFASYGNDNYEGDARWFAKERFRLVNP